ncbi:peptide/nickel transport system substrate-binding protein/nickel transport system substrate-binding protein [Pseudonocardia hierapolitana]|uniref:Peptide/nickel transport system substrate-binding protein/nickel transport system substrate-binding protein n=1 Tax=Pseudonocardia hierapolitana TaxID=1128676 RepID=A0A561SQU1_9PSEU|nr:peptide/nickel transport system substrate-binding protein/nickel transport system substrate-binding protein [Pseudonocardia hierapolitana]
MLVPRFLTLLVFALLVSACASGDRAADGELTLAVAKINATLDPTEALTTSYLRSYGVGESLAKIRPDGTVAPELAESIEQTAPDTWTVVLRDGARFQSGAPVDAEAVRASLEHSAAENELAGDLMEGLTISVLDPRTLTVRSTGPAPFLDYTLSHYELQIHNAATDADFTGPFRVTGFDAERELRLERNPNWWGPPPAVETISVQQVADPEARAQIALAGQADIVDLLPSSAVPELRSADGLTLVGAPAANTVAVYLNPASPVLADQRVRQALAWGVDRAAVAEIAGEGLTEPAPSWLASNPAYPQADQQGFTRYDPDLAGRLLDEAGWVRGPDGRRSKDGVPLAIRLQTWGTEGPTGEVLQAQWDALGADVELSYVDNALVQQARERGDWDAQTAAFTTLGNVPSLFTVQLGRGGSGNYGKYDLPQVAGLVERANTATDDETRTAAVLELNALQAEVVPAIPVHPRPQATAVATRVGGFVAHPLQYENLVQPGITLGG